MRDESVNLYATTVLERGVVNFPIEQVNLFTVFVRLRDPLISLVLLLTFPVQKITVYEVPIWGEAFLLQVRDKQNDKATACGRHHTSSYCRIGAIAPVCG